MIQSNLSGKSAAELELESLYKKRIKLYDELVNKLMKSPSNVKSLIKNYKKETCGIDKNVDKIVKSMKKTDVNDAQ